jgi:hypothetical protein
MPTLVQAKKVHSQLLVAELEGKWKFLGGVVNKTEWRVSFPGGSWIQFVSADVADNARGIRCDVVFVDEADDVDPEIVESVTQPWFSEPRSLRITIIGGTPRRGRYGLLYKAAKLWPSESYWRQHDEGGLSEEEIKDMTSSHFSFHATAYDAPKLVDPRYLARVKRKTLPSVFAREWMCDFDSAEGLVYPMFNEDVHIRAPFLPFHSFLVGMDHGWEDPAVLLLMGVSGYGRDAVVHVIREYCKSHTTYNDIAMVVKEWADEFRGYVRWYADSSGPSQIAEYEKQAQIGIVHATHKIEEGVPVVATMLSLKPSPSGRKSPHMYVSPECPNLIREMGMYRRKRDPKNKELILDEIEDKNNHCQDALRYAIYHVFGGIYSTKTVTEDFASDHYDEDDD